MYALPTKINKLIPVSLFMIIVIFIIANMFNQEEIIDNWYPTDILFIILPLIVIILGIVLSAIYKGSGYHGKAWILFTISIGVWYGGEITYEYDYEYDFKDISTLTSDIFYITGYPIFFAFTILYLIPRKDTISKHMIMIAMLISIVVVAPTLYLTFEEESELDYLTVFLYAIYPILDGLILGPSIIAVMLFFRGEVNFLWTLVLLATISDVVGDTLYLIFSVEESYYPGHPLDILFLFSYVFYAFGVYSHIKLYRTPEKNKF